MSSLSSLSTEEESRSPLEDLSSISLYEEIHSIHCERGEQFETIVKPSLTRDQLGTRRSSSSDTEGARRSSSSHTEGARRGSSSDTEGARRSSSSDTETVNVTVDSHCDRGEQYEVETKQTLSSEELATKLSKKNVDREAKSQESMRSISSISELSYGETDVVDELYDLTKQIEREEQYETTTRHVLFSKDNIEPVFDSHLSGGQSMYEEILPDGTVVRHTKMHTIQQQSYPTDVELVETEGPEREVVDFDEDEEILPDGTIHRISRVRRHSLKHIHRSLKSESDETPIFEGDIHVPGTTREDIVEIFEEPATVVKDVEEVETTLKDGTVVKRKVVSSRVMHKIKTRSLSIDESGNVQEEEEYSVDEIVPGTESAFIEGASSSSSSSTASSYSGSDNEEDDNNRELIIQHPGKLTKESRTHVHFRSDEPGYDGDDILPEQDNTDQSLPPVITITEDNSIPPEEGSDVLAYFGIKNPDDKSLPPDITITEDNSIPPEEGSDVLAYFGIKNPDDDQAEGAEGGELQSARMVMTKQIHTKTVLKDGKEHTTVHEETNVQEDDAPDELRESMQDIINQFMDQPVQQEKQATSHETDI